MKNLFILLILIVVTFSFSVEAQENQEDSGTKIKRTEYTDTELLDLLKSDKEKASTKIKGPYEDLVLSERDAETGIVGNGHKISLDSNRYSLLYHVNSNLKEVSQISSFEFLYARKMQFAWLEFSLSKTTANFEELTHANASATGEVTEELLLSTADLFTFAAGFSYRTAIIQNLFNSDSYFETTSARLAYASFTEQLNAIKYTGLGLQAAFGIHKRTSKRFHIGGVFAYNLLPVKRAVEDETETSSSRSLLLNWVSLAVDLSFYF